MAIDYSPSGSSEQESRWDTLKKKAGKQALGVVAVATAAMSVLSFSACGGQTSASVPSKERTASVETTPEQWTLDQIAIDEYIADLPSKQEQKETFAIPNDLSDAELGLAVTGRICDAINFGATPELREIFNNSGEINTELDQQLRNAAIDKVAKQIAKKNAIPENLIVDYPNVHTPADDLRDELLNTNYNTIGQYLNKQDNTLSECTPLIIKESPVPIEDTRGFDLFYNIKGGFKKTKLSENTYDLKELGTANGFVGFSINESGPNAVISGVGKGSIMFIDPGDESWYKY